MSFRAGDFERRVHAQWVLYAAALYDGGASLEAIAVELTRCGAPTTPFEVEVSLMELFDDDAAEAPLQ